MTEEELTRLLDQWHTGIVPDTEDLMKIRDFLLLIKFYLEYTGLSFVLVSYLRNELETIEKMLEARK